MTLIVTVRVPVLMSPGVVLSLFHSTTFSNARCAVSQGNHVVLQAPPMVLEWRGLTLYCTSAASPQSAVDRRI